jgi:hypothetical protein
MTKDEIAATAAALVDQFEIAAGATPSQVRQVRVSLAYIALNHVHEEALAGASWPSPFRQRLREHRMGRRP